MVSVTQTPVRRKLDLASGCQEFKKLAVGSAPGWLSSVVFKKNVVKQNKILVVSSPYTKMFPGLLMRQPWAVRTACLMCFHQGSQSKCKSLPGSAGSADRWTGRGAQELRWSSAGSQRSGSSDSLSLCPITRPSSPQAHAGEMTRPDGQWGAPKNQSEAG